MKKFFICALMVACLCAGSVFAVDSDLESFDVYSLSPLTSSALDYAVTPLSATSWDTADQNALYAICNALTSSSSLNGGSILYNLISIREAVTDTTDSDNLQDISDALYLNKSASSGSIIASLRDAAYLRTIFLGGSGTFSSPASGSALYYLSYLPNLVSLQSIEYNVDYLEEGVSSILSGFLEVFSRNAVYYSRSGSDLGTSVSWIEVMSSMRQHLTIDSYAPWDTTRYTLYHYVRALGETLASSEDRLLALSQKQNREEISNSFLSGSSGSTSLGASDFGDLSDIGGTVNDTLSLNGQASVSSFTSGLAGADLEGQNWFSSSTRDSLDSVSSSVSTYSLGDPYNMSGWEDNYSWVLGGE